MFPFLLGFAQINADSIPDGIIPKRQIVGTGLTTTTMSSTEVSSSPDPPTSSPDPPTDTEPTSSSPPTSDDTPEETSSPAPTTSEAVQTTDIVTTDEAGEPTTAPFTTTTAVVQGTDSSSDIVVVGSSTIDRNTLTTDTVITSALVFSETIPTTATSLFTSNGQVFTDLITTDRVVASTTGFATSTVAPALQNGDGSGSSLSSSSKKVIGGVVGGVGGAALIGAIALVAWRRWSKKKREAASLNDTYDPNASQHESITKENRLSSGLGFHGQGSVNTASNF